MRRVGGRLGRLVGDLEVAEVGKGVVVGRGGDEGARRGSESERGQVGEGRQLCAGE